MPVDVFLETERLRLRRFTPADVDHLVELNRDPAVMHFITGGIPLSRAEVESEELPAFLGHYKRYGGLGFWAAIDREDDTFLGWFHLRPDGDDPTHVELGYRLRASAWGKGFATEGARALIAKGFREMGVQRVMAYTMAVHAASRRVMEKAGLRYVRTFRADWPYPIPGDEHGDVEYALDRHEWERASRDAAGAG
jgi:RimJ/RimL family protein N-acetyltransferase